MKLVTNHKVIQAWMNDQPAQNHRSTLHTDGKTLFSYRLQIGDTAASLKIVRDYTARGKWGFKSQTTSCHVGKARVLAHLVD